MAKKLAAKNEAIWKKSGPEVKRITRHMGKIVDNSNIEQVTEFFLNAALALHGVNITKRLEGALIGPISLKLAKSGNVVAGAAGVAGLGLLGLVTLSSDINKPFITLGNVPEGMKTEHSGIPFWYNLVPK